MKLPNFLNGLIDKANRLSKKILADEGMQEFTYFSVTSVIIGAVVGLAAVLFHNSIEFFNEIFFKQTAEGLYFLGPAAIVVIPAIGMLIQAAMIKTTPEISKRRGIAEIIKSVSLRGGYIRFRTTVFHFIAPVICIGSGSTVGPEGPAAQLGGGVASKFSQILKLSDSRRRLFTAAGAGAAIAAIFNTPLAGIFFTLEIVLLNELQSTTFAALILSSVSASTVSRILLGNEATFIFSVNSFSQYEQLHLYLVLGILAGLISLLFIRYSSVLNGFIQIKVKSRIPQWILMLNVGLIMGVCGFFYPDIFGIGYHAINKILADSLAWKVVAVLLLMKFLLVPLILNSGGFGGMFAPSLFIGACFGFLFSLFCNTYLNVPIDPVTTILVSMGATLGGMNSIPITAILMIFEMTKEYSFIIPLMLAVVISTTIVQIIIKNSIHVKHLEEQGYRISSGREKGILQSLTVDSVMTKDILVCKGNTPISELVAKLMESQHTTFYIVDENGKLKGTITEIELRPIFLEYQHLREVLVADDLARKKVITVFDNDDLDYVMKIFGGNNLDELPVVSFADPSIILGTVSRRDVISAYNRETLKLNVTDGIVKELQKVDKIKSAQIAEGYSIVEKRVPPRFVGKTLAELRLRNKYGLEVLMIKHENSPFAQKRSSELKIPDANYRLEEGDTLVLFGKDEKTAEAEFWR